MVISEEPPAGRFFGYKSFVGSCSDLIREIRSEPKWEFPLPANPAIIVIMRPANLPEDAREMSRLLQDGTVLEGVQLDHCPTEAEETEYLQSTGQNPRSIRWVVEAQPEGRPAELVGVTELTMTSSWDRNRRLTSGILLANRNWWRHGIASATHRLRTWHAFATLGAYAINSSFLDFNVGSGRALASAGYVQVGCGPRSQLRGGRWRDDILLSCFNPATARVLWPDSDIPSDIQAALIRTQAALDWARQVVQPR